MRRAFRQVDVFGEEPYRGKPLAVVLDGDGLSTEAMRDFAFWTNLSETTFVCSPTDPNADYKVRIFTSSTGSDAMDRLGSELPFAGHPTLGTCHAWTESGGVPMHHDVVVQQCGAGLVRIRHLEGRLAFAAPDLVRSGPVEHSVLAHVASVLRIAPDKILDAEWVDNGPGWLGVLLASADEVLDLIPGPIDIEIGVVGPYLETSAVAFEIRAFVPSRSGGYEDPVTGSLNASISQWMIRTGRIHPPFVNSQGAAMRRKGRVHISSAADGTLWVGGNTMTCISGHVEL